tara:strand:+ start:1114 stop:2640 length:1527 start_codon:yes stop_codon:yes gene_type:complete
MLQKKSTKVLLNKYFSNTKILLFSIVLFGLILRLIFFSGMGASDDLAYSKFAVNIDKGVDPDSSQTLATRLGIIYITALSYNLFGINDFSSVLFVLLTSIGSIILIFHFGKLLFNEKTGLIAAFLLSFFPLEVVYATKLLADIPSAFFMALGVYLFLYAEKFHRNFSHQGNHKVISHDSEIRSKLKYNLGYLFSGIFIGIGYFIRESAVLIALFFIIYIAYKRRIKKEYFLVPLGVLIIFAIELLLFFNFTGDPLLKIQGAQEHRAKVMVEYNYYNRLDFPSGLFHYPYMILTNGLISYFYIFIGIAMIYLLIYKKKETYTMMFWFLALLLYLSFGSTSPTQYLPFLAKGRYLSIITIPGILLLAFFFTEKKYFIKRVVMPLSLIFLLLASIGSVYVREDRNLLDDLRSIYTYLEQLDKAIYTDARSSKALDYISEYKNMIDIRPYPNDLSGINDVYIVINREMVRELGEANKKREFPKEIDKPPNDWQVIKEIGIDDKNKIIIYYVP